MGQLLQRILAESSIAAYHTHETHESLSSRGKWVVEDRFYIGHLGADLSLTNHVT